MQTSLLFYNLYPKYNWKNITASLLQCVPHDEIIVHVTLPKSAIFNKFFILRELRKYPKISKVIFSLNKKSRGETIGFEKLRKEVDLSSYSTLTYIHSKGSSKRRKDTQAVRDWTELMRYFVIEKHHQAIESFEKGYLLYGVLLTNGGHRLLPNTPFHYIGNFVTINLNRLKKEFLAMPCDTSYYGVEMFWGKLCNKEKAFSAHQSGIKDHYNETYSKDRYR